MLVMVVPMSCVILGLHDMFGNTLKIPSVALVFFLIVVFIPGAAVCCCCSCVRGLGAVDGALQPNTCVPIHVMWRNWENLIHSMMVGLMYWYATIALLRDWLYKDSSCAGLTGLGFSLAVLSIAEKQLFERACPEHPRPQIQSAFSRYKEYLRCLLNPTYPHPFDWSCLGLSTTGYRDSSCSPRIFSIANSFIDLMWAFLVAGASASTKTIVAALHPHPDIPR